MLTMTASEKFRAEDITGKPQQDRTVEECVLHCKYWALYVINCKSNAEIVEKIKGWIVDQEDQIDAPNYLTAYGLLLIELMGDEGVVWLARHRLGLETE